MHDGRYKIALGLLGVLYCIYGCATPKHTNVLIFGTNTKFALDVSADTAGSPSITVGYKRQEAVWMPLLANSGINYVPAACDDNLSCLYRGKEGEDFDTYSVLASFGARFSGEYTGTSPKAGGGLAQYFATGLAARRLAEVGGAKLVSIQPEDAKVPPVTYGPDDNSKEIRKWLKKDPKNREALGKWLDENGYSRDYIPHIVNGKEYVELRAEITKSLKVK